MFINKMKHSSSLQGIHKGNFRKSFYRLEPYPGKHCFFAENPQAQIFWTPQSSEKMRRFRIEESQGG